MNSLSSSQRPAAQPVSRSSTGRSIAYIAVFAALVAVLGLPGNIPLPGLVPITAQTLGVMLAGAILGPWRGAASMALFLVLVAIGLPLLSGGRGGLGAFVGPSAGYLVSWILGAAVIGWVMRWAMAGLPGPSALSVVCSAGSSPFTRSAFRCSRSSRECRWVKRLCRPWRLSRVTSSSW